MRIGLLAIAAIVQAATAAPPAPTTPTPPARTRVVLLGTGNPGLDPDRSGPATAVVVGENAYLVDFGPGVVRRASAASLDSNMRKGIPALDPRNLRVAFATHLHSDHTVGYPDLVFSPWTVGRRVPLEVYGPTGIKAMTQHILEAWRVDIETRTNAEGNQREFAEGHGVNAHEVTAGVVYKDASVTVTAFPTRHAMESYGYRFDTPDRRIVISGDTNPARATVEACDGCDVLVHEALTPAWVATRPETFQRFAAKYHTTTPQLAELAREARPKLLVVYHYNGLTQDEVLDDITRRYSGHVVVGRDLDVY